MKTLVNAKPREWAAQTQSLWDEHVAPLFEEGEWCRRANYYTPRPWMDEYNRGSDWEGFVYTVQPGNHVCRWQQEKEA